VSKHTPGPWRCECAEFTSDPEAEPGEVLYHVVMPKPEISKANADLIAAAPELLEAAEAFLGCLPADMSIWRALGLDTSRLTMARMKALAAVTKAWKADRE